MAERAAARSEHIAATVAPAMTDNPAPPAAGSHQNPLHIGSAQAQSHASAVGGDCLTAGSSITASPSTVSRSPARTAFPNPASALQAIPHAVAADTGPQGDNAARDASSHPAQPAACVAEAGVFREEPAGTLPVVQPHPAGTASVTEDDGDNTATERGSSDGEEEEEDSAEQGIEYASILEQLRGLMASQPRPMQKREPLLTSFDLAGIAELIRSGRARRIVCMVGAGISVSAGIPDFRSPGTGLYSQLKKYNLPHPQAVFEIGYFRQNPAAFFMLAKELFPGNFRPTPTHYFIRLLHKKGLLRRCFSQNIDSLESLAGLPRERIVAAHGNFDSAHCIMCQEEHPVSHVRAAVMDGSGEPCRCTVCGGLVKPDIVFFGEALPERFWEAAEADLPAADLLLVLGTSLVVQPFASLVDKVPDDCPRALINRERVGEGDATLRALGVSRGFDFGSGNYRDALHLGDCDDAVSELCGMLGWQDDLTALTTSTRAAAPS